MILDGNSDLIFDTSLLKDIRSEIKQTIVTHNVTIVCVSKIGLTPFQHFIDTWQVFNIFSTFFFD